MTMAKKCDRCGKLYEHYPKDDVEKLIAYGIEKGEQKC